MSLNWIKECPIWRPSFVEAIKNSAVAAAKLLNQFRYASGNSTNRDNSVSGRIPCLPCWRSPNAIHWFVIAIIVYALNAPALFAFPHVSKEISERIHPSVADFNSAPAIAVEIASLGIFTTSDYVIPRPVDFGFSMFVRVPMFPSRHSHFIMPETATGFCFPSYESLICYGRFVSAFASAQATKMNCAFGRDVIFSFGESDKPSKPLTDDVYSVGRHCIDPFFALFSGACSATTGTRCDYEPIFSGVN